MLPDPQSEELQDQVQEVSVDQDVPCERLIGAAGSGKTYTLIQRASDDPSYGLLTSTTGISAVNLGAITVHSTLRYSTTEVLRDIYLSGRLARTLHAIAKRYRRLIIEEYSMSDADQLDLWYRGVQEANRYDDHEPLGILLVGDLAQLPPVKGRWCFEANCWDRFASNTNRLTKIWRQDTGPFLSALNRLREGDGSGAMELLESAGAKWETIVDLDFQGTTILPKNDKVARYNQMGLDRIPKPEQFCASRRWGKQASEWGENPRTREWGIPQRFVFKRGAEVMILSNRPDFSVVNGDGGRIMDWDGQREVLFVEIRRTGKVEEIGKIIRSVEQQDQPSGWNGTTVPRGQDTGQWLPKEHYRPKYQTYVLGQIEYLPVKLNYATTVHKSQSLTLDKVQVDFRDRFFSEPAMLYVALSRCRTLEGLRLVGDRDRFVKQCNIDRRTLPWL
jgi:ATP-dependent DNA helicase PIF1